MKVYRNTPQSPFVIPTHQPMLWAALAFGMGILLGQHVWRPTSWWLIAIACFAAAGAYFLRRRQKLAYGLGLGALMFAGAGAIQLRVPDISGVTGIAPFADGSEVSITGHVIREGEIQNTSGNEVRQVLDLETEESS